MKEAAKRFRKSVVLHLRAAFWDVYLSVLHALATRTSLKVVTSVVSLYLQVAFSGFSTSCRYIFLLDLSSQNMV